MKISCQSCQSKYNVADEKVQGKIVKIRCRKCGSTIVVNGTRQGASNGSTASASAPAPGPVAAPQADGQVWHVNVAEDDQRTMTLSELVSAYSSGAVTQETFIWTEGMEDWKPLAEVDAVVMALHDAAAASVSHAGNSTNGFMGAAPEGPAPAESSESDSLDGADPTRVFQAGSRPLGLGSPPVSAGGASAAADASQAEPKRAAVKREPRTRDLFASRVNADEVRGPTPAEGGAAWLQMSAAAPPTDDVAGKRLGERNENSVLFSLAVLTKTSEARTPADSPSAGDDDDSGLIDLKALAAKTESLRPGALTTDAAAFSAPLGAMPPLGAPIGTMASPLGETARKSRLPTVIGGGALLALLLVAGIAIGVKLAGTRAAAVPVAVAPMPSAPVGSASAPAEAPPSAMASASQAPSSTAAPAAARPRPIARPQYYPAGRPAGAVEKSTEAPAAGAPAKKNDCGCNGDLMCLMKCSTH